MNTTEGRPEFHLQVVRAWEELDKLKFELRDRNTVLYGF